MCSLNPTLTATSSLVPEGSRAESSALHLVSERDLPAWLALQPEPTQRWLRLHGFKAERARVLALPEIDGRSPVVLGLGALASPSDIDPWLGAAAAERAPPGDYRLAGPLPPVAATPFVLGWLLGHYRYARYRKATAAVARPRLEPPAGSDVREAIALAEAIGLARDLVNTPANDLGPAELEAAARDVAARHGGEVRTVTGEALREGYPLIEAVGRGSPREPRLVDLRFARPGSPRVTLVGKGVCFDSGGLDIKPAAGMLLMKKDMGGAAVALGLATALRALDVPVELRVLLPIVENAVDGLSFRPGDVWPSRKGLSVEIGNTDAEGRLVLADALADASTEAPDLLVDLATLTGAARVALGADLPAVFSGDPLLAQQLAEAGRRVRDPVWPMPLWDGYDEELSSRIADLNNAPPGGLGGAITAALFLRRFVDRPANWIHLDLYAWNPKDRPGRPTGGEAQGLRALLELIRQRHG
jgi:leucyl aminopeptidase